MSLTANQENWIIEKYNEAQKQKEIELKKKAMFEEISKLKQDGTQWKKRKEIKDRVRAEIENI